MLQFLMMVLTLFTLMPWQSWVMTALFLLFTTPLVPISSGMLWHLKPLPAMVVARSVYLFVFLVCAAVKLAVVSQGTVSSTSFTSLDFLLTMTRSGFWAVIATSGGMVTPFTRWLSRSA